MSQGKKQEQAFPGLWDEIAANWWFRRIGQFEVHISADPDLGWEVAVLENDQPYSRPSFRKDFSVAVALAQSLVEHYEMKLEKVAA